MTDGRTLNDHLAGVWSQKNIAGNETNWEYAIGVDWSATVALHDARTFKGARALPQVVFRLSDPVTLRFLEQQFNVRTDQQPSDR